MAETSALVPDTTSTAAATDIYKNSKYVLDNAAKTNALNELNSKGITDLNAFASMSPEDRAGLGLSLETQNWASNNLAADKAWYQNSSMLGSIAGLGSAFAQLAALPSQIDYAKTQSKALKQNIATAKEEQARRNKNISSFNAYRTPTSAFA